MKRVICLLIVGCCVGSLQGATFWWLRWYNATTNSGRWADPAMWTVSGTDEDGLPDADDTVIFGTQEAKQGIHWPIFEKVEECYRLDVGTRDEWYNAFSIKFQSGGLRLGAGGMYLHEGNEWQDPCEFTSSFSIELTADQTWDHYGNNWHMNSPISGDYSIRVRGDWRYLNFNHSGSTFSGGFIQESGPTFVSNSSTVEDGVLVCGPLGTGPITLRGGSISALYWDYRLHNPVVFSGNAITFGGGWDWKTLTFSEAFTDEFVLSATEDGALRTMTTTLNAVIERTLSEQGAEGIRLQKNGGAQLTLSGSKPNTFSGGVEILQGTLMAAKNGACGSGSVTVGCLNAETRGVLRISSGVESAIDDFMALHLQRFSQDDGAVFPCVTLDAGVKESVSALTLDGIAQAQGLTYGGVDSGADVILADWFSGTGMIRVATPATVILLQ